MAIISFSLFLCHCFQKLIFVNLGGIDVNIEIINQKSYNVYASVHTYLVSKAFTVSCTLKCCQWYKSIINYKNVIGKKYHCLQVTHYFLSRLYGAMTTYYDILYKWSRNNCTLCLLRN